MFRDAGVYKFGQREGWMQIFGDTKPGGSERRRRRWEITWLGIWGDNMAGYMESQAWGHGEIDRPYIFDSSNAGSLSLFKYLLFTGCCFLCSLWHLSVARVSLLCHCLPKSTYTKLRVDCTACSRSARFFLFSISNIIILWFALKLFVLLVCR